MEMTIHRMYLEHATHGLLEVNGQKLCFTLEREWVANQRWLSCIPEGEYTVVTRFSPRFKHHLQIRSVPDRDTILFHPANHAKRELKGCVAPVSELLAPGWGSRSREAMKRLMDIVWAHGQVPIRLRVCKARDAKIVEQIVRGKL